MSIKPKDLWNDFKRGVGIATSKESWQKSWTFVSDVDWNNSFKDASDDFKKGFTIFIKEGVVGQENWAILTDGKWTSQDASIIFMAYINFRLGGGNTRGTEIPWTTKGIRDGAKSLLSGSKSITVGSKADAEELFLGLYQGKGFKNTTGMSGVEAKGYFGKKST